MNGKLKWIIPYGNHAKISKTPLVIVAKTLDKLSPYKMVSIAGKTLTVIAGFQDCGIVAQLKYKANQLNTGNAGRKNWEVKGIKKQTLNTKTIGNLIKNEAG